MDAPEHTRLRKLVARAFTARAVERMRPRIQDIADRLVDRMVESGPPVDFVAAFAEPLPTAVISQLIGAPSDDHERIRRWMDVMLSVTAHSPDEIEAAAQHVLAYLGELIATKRAQPAEDLLTALIAARDGGDQLSEPELLFTTYILLIAGFETTASLLTNSLLTLQRHPDQLALVRDNPDLIPDAVEELLRYIPITNASLERVATRDVVLGGVPIRAGSTVLPLMYSANRDEALTEEPDRFDVTRRPVPHLTFGHGIHHCLGAPLARMELVVAYRTLLRRLPGLRPADRHAVVWKTGLLTRAPVALPVVW